MAGGIAPQRRVRRLTSNKKRPGRIGAVGELLVAADLMRRGHEIYRPVAADCPTDLLCLRRGSTRVIRVQVRARSTVLFYKFPTKRDADILAIVDLRTRMPGIKYVEARSSSAPLVRSEPDITPLIEQLPAKPPTAIAPHPHDAGCAI